MFYIFAPELNYNKYKDLKYAEKDEALKKYIKKVTKNCIANKEFERKFQLEKNKRLNSDFIREINQKMYNLHREIF